MPGHMRERAQACKAQMFDTSELDTSISSSHNSNTLATH